MVDQLSHIPTEATLPILGTIAIHWNYHAVLMFFVWIVLVPFCITIMRFYKPPPSLKGIQSKVSIWRIEWWWFTVHKLGLFFAMFLALGGAGVALIVSGGFSGSVHACFGMMTILMGVGQLVSSQMRGTHGGKYREGADINDPTTWEGDHFSFTRRRRMFEAYHKTAGYFTLFCALGAVGSGLMQYPMPVLTGLLFVIFLAGLAAWITNEFRGKNYDGYRVAHGYDKEHPHNKNRDFS